MRTPDVIKNVYKGKQNVFEFEVGSGSKPSETEDVPVHLEIMESILEVEVLKKSLYSFKEKTYIIMIQMKNWWLLTKYCEKIQMK